MKKELPSMPPHEMREIREALGATQDEMATKLGVLIRAYQRWEAGDRKIPGPAVLLAKRLLSDLKS